jgi:LPS sulfotransferase NodH
MTDYTRFIILSGARTGSTMLGDSLNSDPRIICFGEIFNPLVSFVPYRVKGYEHAGEQDDGLRRSSPKDFLTRRIFCEHRRGVQAVGFKFHYEHFWEFEGLVELLTGDRELRVIHLKRRNRLRSLVSRRIAERTDRWFEHGAVPEPSIASRIKPSTIGKALRDPGRALAAVERKLRRQRPAAPVVSESQPVALSIDECRKHFRYFEHNESHWEKLFHGHPMTDVIFEEIVDEREEQVARLQRFLGLEPASLSTSLRRQNPEPLHQLITNYDELKQTFAGTPHSVYFDE